ECDLPPKKRKDANMIEVYSDLNSENEEENYKEVYATPRIRITPNTTNRREAKERIKKTSESQQEMRLKNRNITKPIPLTTLMDFEERTLTSNVKKPRRKIPRTPSAIDQLASYNVVEDILNLPSSAKLGQWLKYLDQRRNLTNALKRAIIKETNNVDLDNEYMSDNDNTPTTAIRCTIQIHHSNVQAILDSGAAI
ncbi:264_t:CDS:1, partial [Funneliformis mosseae]